MGASDSHIRLEPHQFGQHFGPPHHRQAGFTRLIQFRVARFNGCRDNNHLSTRQVLRPLPQKYRGTQTLKPTGDLRGFQVRSLHPIALIQQNLRYARHANAADPDKMDRADVSRQFGYFVHHVAPAKASIISARVFVASGLAQLSAASAIDWA